MNRPKLDKESFENVIEIGVKAGIVLLFLIWSLEILSPFLGLLVWSAIIAVALFPLHRTLTASLGDRNKTSATLIGLTGAALILIPVILLALQSVDAIQELSKEWREGTLEIPPPAEQVKEWPLIGEQAHAAWSRASDNLEDFLDHFEPQIKEYGGKLVNSAAAVGTGALFFAASFAVAAIFMATAQSQLTFFTRLEGRITGAEAGPYVKMTIATIRSVAQGIIGIAVIQALLAGLGMLVMDVPLAALWTLGVMILAILQLPSLIVLGPVIAWGFSVYDGTPATLFAIWCIAVGLVDNILKPMLLGRGLDIPMLVILLGAIGGMISMGIVGLFIGSVVLAIGYQLFIAWLKRNQQEMVTGAAAETAQE